MEFIYLTSAAQFSPQQNYRVFALLWGIHFLLGHAKWPPLPDCIQDDSPLAESDLMKYAIKAKLNVTLISTICMGSCRCHLQRQRPYLIGQCSLCLDFVSAFIFHHLRFREMKFSNVFNSIINFPFRYWLLSNEIIEGYTKKQFLTSYLFGFHVVSVYLKRMLWMLW